MTTAIRTAPAIRHTDYTTDRSSRPLRRLHVLVVDDNSVLRQVIRRTLMKYFSVSVASVTEAKDGLAALDHIETNAVDLVLLDLQMPMMNGADVVEAIRRSPGHAELPIVVLTGSAELDVVSRLLQLGIAGYLVKPLSPSVLRDRLADVISEAARQPAADGGRTTGPRSIALRPNTRVLIVDEDLELRKFWIEQLRDLCRVDEATTSTAALRQHHAASYEVIVVGQVAGLLGGQALPDKLREMSPYKPPKVVALVPPDAVVDARRSGRYDGVVVQSTNFKEWLAQLSTCVTAESTAGLLLAPASPYLDDMFRKAGELLQAALNAEVDVLHATPAYADTGARSFVTRVTLQIGSTARQVWLGGKYSFGLAVATASRSIEADRLCEATVLDVMSTIATRAAETLQQGFREAGVECRLGTPVSEVRDALPLVAASGRDISRWLSAATLDSGAHIRVLPETSA